MRYLLIIFGFLLCQTFLAQKETFNWRFGYYLGLSYSVSPPSNVTGSAMLTGEGCACISDTSGNLLFYTDGIKVWNQQNQLMANGTGLLGSGNNWSSQAAIICKKPGSNHLFYIFTVAEQGGNNGLRYHLVDMSLAAGMGSVTTKNVQLTTPVTERLATIKHCNGSDYWIMVQDNNTPQFRAYLLTAAGVNTVPTISSFTNQPNVLNFGGAIKFSPNGEKMALASMSYSAWAMGGFTLFDFDNATGLLSNPKKLLADHGCYSVEFSSDCSKLYGSQIGVPVNSTLSASYSFFQWDLCTDSLPAILASSYKIADTIVTTNGLQLGPDKKIYAARSGIGFNKLGVVNNPNAKGAACNYSLNGLILPTGTVNLGLPNFESSQFLEKGLPLYQYTHTAQSPCLKASFSNPKCAMRSKPPVSLTWKFGDPTSGNLNSATGDTASHVFSAPGTYTVLLIRQFNCYTDTVVQTIAINDFFPTLTFNPKKTICTGEKATLTITGAPSFSWSGPGTATSGTSAIVQPTSTTLYTVVATATNGCTKTNTLQVVVNKCIGLNENTTAFVSIGPNPVTTDLELHAENCQLQSLSIYSLDGRQVMTQMLPNTYHTTVPMADLPNGVYSACIKTEAGMVWMKMIKQ